MVTASQNTHTLKQMELDTAIYLLALVAALLLGVGGILLTVEVVEEDERQLQPVAPRGEIDPWFKFSTTHLRVGSMDAVVPVK